MESLMAEGVESKHWYLAVGDRSIGPLTTELVAKGIESGKVPLTAWICQVGASAWSALSSLGEFQDSVDHALSAGVPANQQIARRDGAAVAAETVASNSSYAHPQDEHAEVAAAELPAFELPEEEPLNPERAELSMLPYERATSHGMEGSDFVTSARPISSGQDLPGQDLSGQDAALRHEMPSMEEESGQREVVREFDAALARPASHMTLSGAAECEAVDPAVVAARAAARVSHDDLGIDITFDEDHENAIDWDERFQSYFLVGTEVELPEEERLLQSLRETPRATFLHDEAVWNLSLCLAFGSDAVARATAQTFFEAVGLEHGPERLEWICRTLLSKGFMPSGIPRLEGMRGLERLRESCPFELLDVLERESVD